MEIIVISLLTAWWLFLKERICSHGKTLLNEYPQSQYFWVKKKVSCVELWLTHEVLSKIVADDILKIFFITIFLRK